MKLAWHFSKVNPRFKNREATQGEFFSCDTELRAFVREAIQNSLDARRPGHQGPVAIRIFLSGSAQALSPEASRRYFRGGWEHFTSAGSGLRDAPAPEDPCCYVVYEDSGTTGLTGDVEQYHDIPGVGNPFYYFFRAEGQSHKQEAGRGRWGLGKFVFPRSSRIRSFFGLTVRQDDGRRLLVGQSILKSHHVDGRSFTPDGWFGRKPEKKEAAIPVEDEEFIAQFERDFCLERHDDPGLSIVIPYSDPSWQITDVARCVIEDYFYPILRDDLVVAIEDPESQFVVQSHSIDDVLAGCDPEFRPVMQPLLDLTRWALTLQRSAALPIFPMSASRGGMKWSRELCSSEVFEVVRRGFIETGRAAVRVQLTIQIRGQSPVATHFDLVLQRQEENSRNRPVYIRDGIVISDVRSRMMRHACAVLAIDDPPLARLLGDAENPSHTDWHEESSHFKGRYVQGPAILRFIRNAAPDLYQQLVDAPEPEDAELLLDVFSIGSESEQSGYPVGFETRSSRHSRPGAAGPKRIPAGLPARPYRVSRRKGGFRIVGGLSAGSAGGSTNLPSSGLLSPLIVQVAYDRRSGSALRRYSPADFQLDVAPIRIAAHGAETEIVAPNVMHLRPFLSEFEVTVTGFDVNRDLFLSTQPLRSAPESPVA